MEAGPATPGRGRNIGIAAAHHEWIALTDAGIRLEPTWLEHLLGVVEQDPKVDVVYGNYEPVTDSFFERCAGAGLRLPKVPRWWMDAEAFHRVQPDSPRRMGGGRRVSRSPRCRGPDLYGAGREGGFGIGWAPAATIRWRLQPSLTRTFRKFALIRNTTSRAGRQ